MCIPFEQLSDNARIWIYQANRVLKNEEKEEVLRKTKNFLAFWTSHGNPLRCSADMVYNQFLILAVEESFQGVTGCAVDASIRFIQSLEKAFRISLLDRSLIACRQDGKDFIVPLEQLQKKIQQGVILADTLIFDNTITKKAALASKWQVRARDSWIRKHFPSSS